MKQWIGQFVPKLGSICPGFHRVRYLAACPHGCAYCYLQGVYWRGRPRDITEDDLPEMERAVTQWMQKYSCGACSGTGEVTDYKTISLMPTTERRVCKCLTCQGTGGLVLNAGELSDSFAPDICTQASLRVIEIFRRQGRHTLLLLTKARPTALFDIEPTPQVIVSFSLGQQTYLGAEIASGTPAAASVLGIALTLLANGWRVRLRIDPLINETGVWEIMTLFQETAPVRWERITLGTLRFTTAGYRAVAHGSPFQAALAARVAVEAGEVGTHPYRLPLAHRSALYSAALEVLEGKADDFGLCKETLGLYDSLRRSVVENHCNCMP